MTANTATCRYCDATITLASGAVWVDADRSRHCPARHGARHMPRPMRTSDLFLAVHGDECDASDPLIAALRAAGE